MFAVLQVCKILAQSVGIVGLGVTRLIFDLTVCVGKLGKLKQCTMYSLKREGGVWVRKYRELKGSDGVGV